MNQNHTIFSLLLERLPISTAREYVKGWDKDKAKHLFGDKYRIYIPLKLEGGKIPEIESDVKDMIERKYKLKFVDYGKGLVIHPLSKKITRLSRAMSKEEYAEIQHQFDNDEARRGASNIKETPIVCISRHPYDIAGQSSSDRGWINCKTIIVPWGRKEVEYEGGETDRLHPESKHNLVTYLIRPDDRNINNPIARLTVHAYYAKNNPIPYFISDKTIYGTPGIWEQAYMDTVEDWLDKKQREIELDIDYEIAPGVRSWELPKTMGMGIADIITTQYGNDIDWIREHIDELEKHTRNKLLIYAASKGHENIVKMLIPVSDPKDMQSMALRLAAQEGHDEIVKMLIPVSDPKADNSYVLLWAARYGRDKCVKLLIPVSETKAYISDALRSATLRGHKKCVQLLIPVSDPEVVEELKPRIKALGIKI